MSAPKGFKPVSGFKKGHGAYISKVAKALAHEVRVEVPARIMVQWHKVILMGRSPILVEDEDAEGGIAVAWQESGGVVPDATRQDASMKWLADRGHGQAAQLIAIEQTLRVDGSASTLQLSELTPAVLLAVRDELRLSSASATDHEHTPADPELTDEIDASSVEIRHDSSAL